MDTYSRNLSKGSAMMEDEQSASRMMGEEAERATAEKAPKGWVVDNVTIRQAKNGGWIVGCSKHQEPPPKNGSGYQSADYTFASLAEAVPFIEQEFGESVEGGGQAGMPAPTPAAPVA